MTVILEREDFQQLFDVLSEQGYTLMSPTVRDGAILYEEIANVTDLPIGYTDEQEGGRYRLVKRADQALFGYNAAPQSWKKYLYPASVRLWQTKGSHKDFEIIHEAPEAPRYAFIGVRPCELAAIAIQDRVFLQGEWVDPTYKARRENAFIVAVNCGQAGGTCFCDSLGTGPKAAAGYDLALTEILEGEQHYFVVESGSEQGTAVLDVLPVHAAAPEAITLAERVVEATVEQMQKRLDTTDLKSLLYRNTENPHWDDVAARCLSCGNCTMVCPTCFCTTVEDVTDLSGEQAERRRKWDSCFTMDFSYIHGGSVRYTPKARYRQWMTHKMATWIDQFGTSGCVGCGRCITWCPVGIDITAEVESDPAQMTHKASRKRVINETVEEIISDP